MEQIKKYILSQVAKQQLSKEEAKQFIMKLSKNSQEQYEDIAIIGMAGRFAKASNLNEFWTLLEKEVNCIREFPKERVKDFEVIMQNPYYTEFMGCKPLSKKEMQDVHQLGGYLDEVDKFDSSFFGISPNEATYMDPNQRVALEVAWEAMEDAGYGGDTLKGSRTGVYIGRDGTNYTYYKQFSEPNQMQLTGSWESILASRISYLFDFKGPCMLIDTACSAGLVSIHMAIQAIRTKECDVAIAGGINLMPTGEIKSQYALGANMANVESGDGFIRTFDDRAHGTVWGEGAGMVVLKTLKQAIEDGDNIHAVIKGSAINNDGCTNSLTAPSAKTQEEVILDCWEKAGISPEAISYIEAHGTGTILGDPIEIKGITNAFRHYTKKNQFCAIGSLKTNMGHMVAASGVASLMKVVLSLKHKEIVPTINFNKPNTYINFMESPIYISDKMQKWEAVEGKRYAAINSFGFSRTNCHMVVGEAPEQVSENGNKPYYCLTISAKNPESFKAYLKKYITFIEETNESLMNICYTSNIGRGHYAYRAVFIGSTKEEMIRGINKALTLENLNYTGKQIYIGYHNIVSDKKKLLEQGDISARECKNHSELAMFKLSDYLQKGYPLEQLMEVCRLYIEGAEIDWYKYYEDEKCKRVSIPTYPLQKTRYWANPKITQVKGSIQANLHPLVHHETVDKAFDFCYETTFEVENQWVLSDHQIKHQPLVPGTTYLEMARFVGEQVLGQKEMVFKDVFFLMPLMVTKGEHVLARIRGKRIDNGLQFNIESCNEKGQWRPHAEGKIFKLEGELPKLNRDLTYLKSQGEKEVISFDEERDTTVFNFGEHWNNVTAYWNIGNDALVQLRINDKFKDELNILGLHPAMLDNAINFTSQNTGETFLPFTYKHFEYYNALPAICYSYIHLQENKDLSGETMTYDVDLLDEQGNVVARVIDYTTKKVHNVDFGQAINESEVLQMKWQIKKERSQEQVANNSKWAMISRRGERSQQLTEALEKAGVSLTNYYLEEVGDNEKVFAPNEEGLNSILDRLVENNEKGIIFAVDYTTTDEECTEIMHSSEALNKAKMLGVDALFKVYKLVMERRIKLTAGLKVLGRETWKVDGSENLFMPLSAATLSLAGVMGQEYSALKVDQIEIANGITMDEVAKECINYSGDGLRALRLSGVYEQVIEDYTLEGESKFEVKTDGVYVISGGLGGIGLSIAERLAERGKVNIVLLGRREIASEDKWLDESTNTSNKMMKTYSRLLNIKRKVNTLQYQVVNVTNSDDVVNLGKELKAKYGKLLGIYHAAGVAGEGFLMNKEDNKFLQVTQPKINGAMNLYLLVREEKESFLALFSSITALTGGEGQGDYCAGNAFMDALVNLGEEEGCNVCAVNWPSWNGSGMSVDFDIDESQNLFKHIEMQDGLNLLEKFIAEPRRLVIPTQFNEKVLKNAKEELPFKLGLDIEKRLEDIEEKADNSNGEQIEVNITGLANLTETQLKIGYIFSMVLGESNIDAYTSFQDMGGNSLMATELIKLLEEQFNGVVDISDLFSYPSVAELSEFIDGKLAENNIEANDNNEDAIFDSELRELIKGELGEAELEALLMDEGSEV